MQFSFVLQLLDVGLCGRTLMHFANQLEALDFPLCNQPTDR